MSLKDIEDICKSRNFASFHELDDTVAKYIISQVPIGCKNKLDTVNTILEDIIVKFSLKYDLDDDYIIDSVMSKIHNENELLEEDVIIGSTKAREMTDDINRKNKLLDHSGLEFQKKRIMWGIRDAIFSGNYSSNHLLYDIDGSLYYKIGMLKKWLEDLGYTVEHNREKQYLSIEW